MIAKLDIITPALAAANNGNWRTAARWRRCLAGQVRVSLRGADPQGDARGAGQAAASMPDAAIALHARRSAEAIARLAAAGVPVAVVLTGTDLYRDLPDDVAARRSLALATRLVVLQADGLRALAAIDPALAARTLVIEQSARAIARRSPPRRRLDLVCVGHLREEKDPATAVRAVARLQRRAGARPVRLTLVGAVLDEALGGRLARAATADARIVLAGALPHAAARARIARAHALVLPSRMEGGANVLIEAVRCDVPVLASRIGGTTGLLGDDYPGLFEAGDDRGLARLIERLRDEPAFEAALRAACARAAPRFEPARECAQVRALVAALLDSTRPAAR